MTYLITKTDGTLLIDLADGSEDTTSSPLTLFGKGFLGWGTAIQTNMVSLAENFASVIPPTAPLTGTLWYDTSSDTLMLQDDGWVGVATQDWVTQQIAALPISRSTAASGTGSGVTSDQLNTALAAYVSNSALVTTLTGYATTAQAASFVTSAALSNTLAAYASETYVNTQIAALLTSTSSGGSAYVTANYLTSQLSGYVTTTNFNGTVATLQASIAASSGGITQAALTQALAPYATTASLSAYVVESALTSTLSSYVTETAFNTAIANLGTGSGSSGGITQAQLTTDLQPYALTVSTVASAGGNASATVVQPTGASVSRTLAQHLSDEINVLDFGATGNGSTDDTSSIQAALNTGKPVYLPAGTYIVSGTLLVQTTGQKVFGAGRATILATTSLTADIMQIGTTAGVEICDIAFGVAGSIVRTGGVSLNLITSSYCNLHDIYITDFFVGMQIGVAATAGQPAPAVPFVVRVRNIEISVGAGTGVATGMIICNGVDVCITDVLITGSASEQLAEGVTILGAGDVTLDHVEVLWGGSPLVVAPPAGAVVQALWVHDCFFDTGAGWGVYCLPAGTIQLLKFHNNWVATNGGGGMLLSTTGSGLIQQTDILNCTISNNTGIGLLINTPQVTHTNVIGSSFSNNSESGIYVQTGVTSFRIDHCTSGPSGEFAGNTAQGLVLGGANDHFHITNNTLVGNASALAYNAPSTVAGSSWWILNNEGFANVAKGTLVTTAGPSTFTVNHGLSFIPNASDISLSLNSGLGSAASYYVAGAPTSTSFTIGFNSAPGAGVNVLWVVRGLGG